ncbi:MAG: S41 family peptidase [Clostridia bacterium]|nr:S41 family peptidase [Clostridia bacterium]
MDSKQRKILYSVLALLITVCLTAGVTVLAVNANRSDTVTLTAQEYSELSKLFVLQDILDSIDEKYYGEAPSRDELIADAAKGMVNGLGDEYAQYFTAQEYEEFISNLNGEYSGIGMLVAQPDDVGSAVLDVYEDNAAEAAGVQIGDIIIKVDSKIVAGMELSELSALINGEIGSFVKLTLLRGEETIEVDVERTNINIKRVHYSLFKEQTGYIRIDMFTGSCAEEFSEAIKYLTDRGMRSLVIDLRNNPGGSLDIVVDVADTLLGDCSIVTVGGSDAVKNEEYRGNGKGVEVPIAVIVNENSASASEILAGAVKDNQKGAIVGMKTFGKGIVQTTFKLESDGSWLKMTTSAYFTPSGANIHGVGIVPDIEVELPDSMQGIAISELEQDDDAQLWAALDYVREQAEIQE